MNNQVSGVNAPVRPRAERIYAKASVDMDAD